MRKIAVTQVVAGANNFSYEHSNHGISQTIMAPGVSMEVLKEKLLGCLISVRDDISCRLFFQVHPFVITSSWGYLKDQVFRHSSQTTDEEKDFTCHEITELLEAMAMHALRHIGWVWGRNCTARLAKRLDEIILNGICWQ